MYWSGLKSNRPLDYSTAAGNGHSAGLIERSSDFQTLYIILRSTTEGL